MVVKVKMNGQKDKMAPKKPIIAPIRGAPTKRENVIIRAIRIMIVDIRMVLHRKETEEQIEAYRQFCQLVGRK
jgi:hypothetical protein